MLSSLYNYYRMVWVVRDLRGHLVPIPSLNFIYFYFLNLVFSIAVFQVTQF